MTPHKQLKFSVLLSLSMGRRHLAAKPGMHFGNKEQSDLIPRVLHSGQRSKRDNAHVLHIFWYGHHTLCDELDLVRQDVLSVTQL